jgi:hypothetical protein
LIAACDLTSPQKIGNLWLFAMRITGTGVAYRHKPEEYAVRDPSIYLNDEFLARCGGLPVIWEHPPMNTLTTQEYAKRVIGAIMFGYIVGTEVWGIARINDEEAAMEMVENRLSTSPAVVWANKNANVVTKTKDGNDVMVEGNPVLLDHLAVCNEGVWDKGGEPAGISVADSVPVFNPSKKQNDKIDIALNKVRMLRLDLILARHRP